MSPFTMPQEPATPSHQPSAYHSVPPMGETWPGHAGNSPNVTTADLFILFQELLRNSRSGQPHGPKLHAELPKFNGRPNESLSMWIFQANNVFRARGIENLDRLPYVSTCLGEAALAWYHNWYTAIELGNSQPIASWHEFELGIRAAFEPPRQQQLLRTQLRNLKQTTSTQNYTYSFRAILGQIASMHEEDKISYYLHGLHPKLRGDVETKEPQLLEDAIKVAITLDQIRPSSVSPFPVMRTAHKLPFQKGPVTQNPDSKPIPMEIGTISTRLSSKRQGNKEPEYYKKYCSKCPRYGHTDEECRTHPSLKSNSTLNLVEANPIPSFFENNDDNSDDNMLQMFISKHNGKLNELLLFHGIVNNNAARILVDSGASFDYISSDFVKQHNLQTTPISARNVTVADGTPYKTSAMLKGADVYIGNFRTNINLHTFPLTTCDIILGKPFLFRYNPLIDWRTNAVEIPTDSGSIFLRTDVTSA
jgi:hypothetical protein